MEHKIIKVFSISSIIVMILIVVFVFMFSDFHDEIVMAREQRILKAEQEKELLQEMTGLELMNYYTKQEEKETTQSSFSQQLRLELPSNVSMDDLTVENDQLNQKLKIQIPTEDEDYFYNYLMIGKSNHIQDIDIEANGTQADLEVTLDGVYEMDITQEEQYVYIDFIAPKELYDKVIVIDAGHGGKDPGAVYQEIYEKDINLQILLKLKELFDAQDEIHVYYTRTDDTKVSLTQRVQFANLAQADLFLSIHNNEASISGTSGTEVLFNDSEEDGEMKSERFAQICEEELCAGLGSKNLGVMKGSEIKIVRESTIPVALVEVGFMSNTAERRQLNDEAYQAAAAQALYQAVLRAYDEIM